MKMEAYEVPKIDGLVVGGIIQALDAAQFEEMGGKRGAYEKTRIKLYERFIGGTSMLGPSSECVAGKTGMIRKEQRVLRELKELGICN